jgi:hypothetical protein
MVWPGAFTKVCTLILVAGVYLPGVISSAATLKPLVAGKRGSLRRSRDWPTSLCVLRRAARPRGQRVVRLRWHRQVHVPFSAHIKAIP